MTRQFEALVTKSLIMQKRAWFMNICCIGLCPVIIIAISAGLGAFVTSIVSNSFVLQEYLYCSNVSAMTSLNLPIWDLTDTRLLNVSSAGIPSATLSSITHLNYLLFSLVSVLKSTGASPSTRRFPCVFWFGESIPNSSLYEREPNLTSGFPLDTSFMAQPSGGWFNAVTRYNDPTVVNVKSINAFIVYQQRTCILYTVDSGVDASLLGSKPATAGIPYASFDSTSFQSPFVSPLTNASIGILGTIPTRYWMDINTTTSNYITINNLIPVPFYNLSTADDFTMDIILGNAINAALAATAQVDKSALLKLNPSARKSDLVYALIDRLLNDLPHGAIHFRGINHTSKSYNWLYQIGSDKRLAASTNIPDAGLRLLLEQNRLDNGILRTSNVTYFGNASISAGVRFFPQVGNNNIVYPFGGLIGAILYPFGISFLLPLFTIILVKEREDRIYVMMAMNGMAPWVNYVVHYLTFMILFCFSGVLFYLAGYISKLTLFTANDPVLVLLIILLWGLVETSLAFFLSTFFVRSRNAIITVFAIVLCGVIVQYAIDQLFTTSPVPLAYLIWPPFAFYRALSLLNRASFTVGQIPFTLSNLKASSELYTVICFLIVEMFVFQIVSIYLMYVFPSEFGVPKPWHFPISDTFKYLRNRQKKRLGKVVSTSETRLARAMQLGPEELALEDEDVRKERQRVDTGEYDPDSPLVVQHIRKLYPSRFGNKPKLAVKDVTFACERGIVLGLLGPNGAGKTSLISVLTGLYRPSAGNAYLNGFDIVLDTETVYKNIGICPQFDILWEDLTVAEHLYFYARLKGISRMDEADAVSKALENVSLSKLSHRFSNALSGGEKRRLSIAISLLGDPPVVFLDEPTTGLDPEVRRLIWNIITKTKKGKTMVLTTHSMEEAEALCQRIGIMAKGTLRCFANPTRLKELYGSGYKLYINTNEDDTERACVYIESLLPTGFKKLDAFATSTTYEFSQQEGILAGLFKQLEETKSNFGILDWGVGQTTLEEVFLKLISESDASHE